jgi:hypothetical protein
MQPRDDASHSYEVTGGAAALQHRFEWVVGHRCCDWSVAACYRFHHRRLHVFVHVDRINQIVSSREVGAFEEYILCKASNPPGTFSMLAMALSLLRIISCMRLGLRAISMPLDNNVRTTASQVGKKV